MESSGWRIQRIDHGPPGPPRFQFQVSGPLVGVLVFLAGVAATVGTDEPLWAIVAVAGLAFAFASLLYMARRKRASWVQVSARCIDREVGLTRGHKGSTWAFRILCEFEHAGQTYRVTPTHWKYFGRHGGQARAEQELDRLVDANGVCRLYIDPANPLEAEFATYDIKDALLYPRP